MCCLFKKILITNKHKRNIPFVNMTYGRKLQYINRFENYTHHIREIKFYFGYDIYKLSTCRSGGIAWLLIVMMYIQRLFLRFTTAPTQSVFATKKCRISEVDKFCEAVVNRKYSHTTKSTIYDLLWNGGLENVSDYTGCRHTQVLF